MSAQATDKPSRHPGMAGRTALVTGAAGGIGRAIVEALLSQQVQVLATDRDNTELESLQDPSRGNALLQITADLTGDGEPARLVECAIKHFGSLDILVNNAGCIIRRDVMDTSVQDWDLMMSVNLKAAFFLAKQAAVHMRNTGWGRIINMTSQAGHTGGAVDCPVYAITKGALMTMTRSLARALAADGVTVNAVAPGIVMTEMISGTLNRDQIAELLKRIPVGRASEAEEIAEAIVFLSSDQAGSITGHVLDINGGMVMR